MPTLKRRNATVELADGRILEVRVINPDTLRYEQTAARRNWEQMTIKDGVATVPDQTIKSTYEVWAALKRTGQYDGDWDTFYKADCVDFNVEETDVDPTQSAPPTTSPQPSPGDSADSDMPTSSELTTSS